MNCNIGYFFRKIVFSKIKDIDKNARIGYKGAVN